MWLYGVLFGPTSVRHRGLEQVVDKGGLNILEHMVAL